MDCLLHDVTTVKHVGNVGLAHTNRGDQRAESRRLL